MKGIFLIACVIAFIIIALLLVMFVFKKKDEDFEMRHHLPRTDSERARDKMEGWND